MTEDSTGSSFFSFSKPKDRKSCKICAKFIYLHQPILCCHVCRDIVHGKCLGLTNDQVFVLQQFPWNCNTCNSKSPVVYSCETCWYTIDIYSEKFVQCEQCCMIVHTSCIRHKRCVSCTPDHVKYSVIHSEFLAGNSTRSNDSDYYRNQPYFEPFQAYERDVLNWLPDAEELSENLQNCSEILSSCTYYTVERFGEFVNYNTDLVESAYFMSLNLDGVKSNFDKFRILRNQLCDKSNNIYGYFLCETNVTDQESQPYFIDGYNKFVLDRLTKSNGELKHKGSGILIYLHESFNNVEVCKDLCFSTFDFECLVIKVVTKDDNYLLVGGYRSPNGNFNKFLEILDPLLESFNSLRNFKTVIFGDFNINLYKTGTDKVTKYLDCLFSNGFLPIISRATHFAGQHPTCIDHILTNDLADVNCTGIIEYNVSHHFMTFLSLNIRPNNSRKSSGKPRIKLNQTLLHGFLKDLNYIGSQVLGETQDSFSADESYSTFHDLFKDSYDKWFINSNSSTVPNYRNLNNLRNDWISIGLAKSCDIRSKLYEVWQDNKTDNNWNIYKDYDRSLNKLLSKAKYDYYDRKFKDNQNDIKKTWQLINRVLGRKRSNRLLVFPDQNAAHTFNEYFTNIAYDLIKKTYNDDDETVENSDTYKKYMPPDQSAEDCIDDNMEFSCDDVKYFITKLNNGKGTYFSPRVLKLVSATLSPILTRLFNKCLSEGYFPKELKIAKIIPIYKNKGSIADMKNYRPISMLSVFSKLFEKLIHKEITNFFDRKNILNDSQYGFRKSHSTLHALINATENIYQSVDNKQHTLGIFIDFSKAFDTVNHSILLDKLSSYGIKGNLHSLLTDYLSNRKQYVSYGGLDSALLDVTCGVPQGSVLGPLLFIIFINDIINVSSLARFVLFADDLNLFISSPNRAELYSCANTILEELYKYCFSNRLIINYDKCCFMEFNVDKNAEKLYLGIRNIPFIEVNKCKFLGVFIKNNLSWDDQIKNVQSQVSKSCGSIYSIRNRVPAKILRKLYMALVQPYLLYCIPIWGSQHKIKCFDKLFILQKKCIRVTTNHTNKVGFAFEHTKPLFCRLKALTIYNLYNYVTAAEAMKIVEYCSPVTIYNMYKISERSHRFILPKVSLTEIMNKSFTYQSMKILNYLIQHDIKYYELSIDNFKTRLKKHLLNLQSVSVNGEDDWLPCNHDLFSDITVA